jgi:peroxiredoxin (alkyl hydroperoxide reductase subunit C)
LKQFDEKDAQVIGMSTNARASLKAWAQGMGGIAHPLVSDYWPHGATIKAYDVLNEESGTAKRSLFIIDKEGIVRHKEMHQGTLPDPQLVLAELEKLQA